MPCTTVTNFCSESKVMLLLSMVRYQGLHCFRQDAIAINKLCKLNFRYFLLVSSRVIRAFLNMDFTFFETLVCLFFTVYLAKE